MLVPGPIFGSSRTRRLARLAAMAVLACATATGVARDRSAVVSIPLEPLGFQPQLQQFLLAGSSMMTIDYVDSKHLLITYGVKRLLKRLPECLPTDQDRMVEAVLLELPTGRELARTSWRLHDRGMYLWKLADGRFLLRTRDNLSTIAPLANLASSEPFHERPLLTTKRRIGAVLLSPDADLLILETMEPPKPQGLEEAMGALPAAKTDEEKAIAKIPVQIDFFGMRYRGHGDEVDLVRGESTRSRFPGRIPANSAGFLAIVDEGQQHWAFDFNTYDGKRLELSPFDSSCRPAPILISRSEFIAFGCHLSHTPQVIGGFNMRGEEMWEQNMPENYMAPTFSYAPSAGRFAFSRIITHTSMVIEGAISPELIDSQSVVVYQAGTGAQLFHLNLTPVARAGQNFALAPDGQSVAVLHDNAIEVYPLPDLSGRDRASLQRAEAAAPTLDSGLTPGPRVNISQTENAAEQDARRMQQPAAAPQEAAADSAQPAAVPQTASPSEQAPAADTPAAKATQPAATQSDDTPDEPTPRKPPTLYNEPGEHSPNAEPR